MIRPRVGMVLAAGRGERLRPITDTLPKPLVRIAGRALLDHAIDRLEAAGIERVIVNVHYLGDIIAEHLAQRSAPEIVIAREATALETGGGVKHAMALLGDEPFFVVNGDSLWLDGIRPALIRLADAWDPATTDAMLLLQRTATRRRLWRGAGRLHCSSARPAAPGARPARWRRISSPACSCWRRRCSRTCRTACSR